MSGEKKPLHLGVGYYRDSKGITEGSALALRLVHDVGEGYSFDVEVNTTGSKNDAQLGVRYTSQLNEMLSMTFRLRLREMHLLDSDSPAIVLLGTSGGAAITAGNEQFAVSLGVDATLLEFAWVEGIPGQFGDFGFTVNPYIGLDVDAGPVGIFAQAGISVFALENRSSIKSTTMLVGLSW